MPTAAERRTQVLVGELPADFLRIQQGPSGTCIPQTGPGGAHIGILPPAGAFIPPNTRGRLSITIVQAKLAKNYGLVRMDPYCRLRVGNTIFETPTDQNGAKTPKWNRTILCYLPQSIDAVYLEIFDERAFTNDERIAWGHIVIPEAVFNGEAIDDWYCLSGSQGEAKEGMVNVIFTFTHIDAPPVAYMPLAHPHGSQGPEGGGVPESQMGPRYTDEDVKELQEMFPQMEDNVIRSVLDEKCGNKDATINALLSLGEDVAPPESSGGVNPAQSPPAKTAAE